MNDEKNRIAETVTIEYLEFFYAFLVFLFYKIYFFKNLSAILSECHMVWIQIRTDLMSVLIWVQICLQGLSADDRICR